MAQETSENGRDEDLHNFFLLYRVFLEIDAFASLTNGRNRSLIRSFYNFYFRKANKDDKFKEAKNTLKVEFEKYVCSRKEYHLKIYERNEKQSSNYLPHIVNNPNISKAFKDFCEATEQYAKWRECLSQEQIKLIYIANLKDRQQYYASGDGVFEIFNTKIIETIDVSQLDNNKILKQSLIEFHNATSHLNAVYWGYGNTEKNKERAINHFNRGALDSYKSIIKDFFIIKPYKSNFQEQEYKTIIDTLKESRKNEYERIGYGMQVCQSYYGLTTHMIDFLKSTSIKA